MRVALEIFSNIENMADFLRSVVADGYQATIFQGDRHCGKD